MRWTGGEGMPRRVAATCVKEQAPQHGFSCCLDRPAKLRYDVGEKDVSPTHQFRSSWGQQSWSRPVHKYTHTHTFKMTTERQTVSVSFKSLLRPATITLAQLTFLEWNLEKGAGQRGGGDQFASRRTESVTFV